ncbi:TMEM175 family protein [Enterococcus wangshanyuanii]|uniref:Ferrochelatase n=1 Tax=Enterococcus wangshanyuanii TaxID=2005703 RepID=A0ABQ1PEA5_9ENTE|nr:TMEM175 family protein [Enterococcus wangshanyuanii]GGC95450.1 ferrochelatase [Enterococcus wangshanyuanii]
MSKSRLEAFTDAVIAIVMTILVLELHQPTTDTLAGLAGIEKKLFIYIVSFVMLAIYWNNHHHMFQLVHKINGRVLWANNFFIFTLTLVPFATAWVGDFIDSLVPQLTYGIMTLIANCAYLILTKELIRANGKESALGKLFQRYNKAYITIFLNILGLGLGWLIHPYFVLILNIGSLIMWIIPDRRIENKYKE